MQGDQRASLQHAACCPALPALHAVHAASCSPKWRRLSPTCGCNCACAQLTLCGQAPEAALTAALASVNFYCGQLELAGQYRESKVQRRASRMQELCKKKLEEVHNGYTVVRALPSISAACTPSPDACMKLVHLCP